MQFSLLGVPVSIRALFWLTAVLLGVRDARTIGWWVVPIFVAVMTVSVLIHELGHALAFIRHRMAPSITLHAMGGVTVPGRDGDIGRLDRALISLAGPAAGLAVGLLAFLGARALPPDLPIALVVAVSYFTWINIAWSLFNLLPVIPFDGGHVMQEIFGPRRARTAAGVSLAFAVIFAALAAWQDQVLVALIFAMSAIQSYQLYTLPPGTILVNPLTAPSGTRAASSPSPLRRWWLERKLRKLEAEREALEGERRAARRRAGGPDLRVIRGGADRPKDRRDLN